MARPRVDPWARSTLFLAGAFTFVFLLGEAVHEAGHYLTHLAYGNAGVRIHLDPFGGSHIAGVGALPITVLGVTSAAGPLLNLVCGAAVSQLLWRKEGLGLLQLQLWGPVAAVQEGVTFSLGLLTPGGDASWVVAWGVPKSLTLAFGVLLLLAGTIYTGRRLSRDLLAPQTSLVARIWITVAGISSLMLLRAVHSAVLAPALVAENVVPLSFSIVLSLLVVAVSRYWPTRTVEGKASVVPVRWSSVLLALGLGTTMIAAQMLVP